MSVPTPPDAPTLRRARWLLALGALAWAVVGLAVLAAGHDGLRGLVVTVDHAVAEVVAARRGDGVVALAHGLAVAGGVWVTAPLRVAVAGVLLLRRDAWRLTAWLTSIVLMELTTTVLKAGFDRPRPPGALEATRSAAFPSGHTSATAVTLVVLALLVPPRAGPRRSRLRVPRFRWWLVGAGITLMGASRVVLGVHWVSDVVVGAALGVGAGLVAVGGAELVAARRHSRHPEVATRPDPTQGSDPAVTSGERGPAVRSGERDPAGPTDRMGPGSGSGG